MRVQDLFTSSQTEDHHRNLNKVKLPSEIWTRYFPNPSQNLHGPREGFWDETKFSGIKVSGVVSPS
jgi:hypothetical protein